MTELRSHSDRRGAGRDTRGRVCSPIPTEYSRLRNSRSAFQPFPRNFKFSIFHFPFSILCLAAVVLLFALSAQAATLQTQTFRLNPGWNAIYLEVQPAANSPGVVFRNVPLQSLWTYAASGSTVEFIQNPNEPMANRSQWLMFVPTNRVESFQNSLFAVQGHRAYLVEVNGTAPVTLTVTGQPSLRPVPWTTDGYTLRGLPVDPAKPPSFAVFFSGSAAHYDSALRRLQPVYRLNATGQWTRVDADDTIISGEACWVLTRGSSDYPGPLQIDLPAGDAIDFGSTVPSITLRLVNRSPVPRQVSIGDLGDPASNPLSYSNFDRIRGDLWEPLLSTNAPVWRLQLAPQQARDLRLSVRRSELTPTGYSSVLVIGDGQGLRRWVPVRAGLSTNVAVALQAAARAAGGAARKATIPGAAGPGEAAPRPPASFAGLWFGSATVTNVSEVHSGTLQTNATQGVTRSGVNPSATPTASQFTLRLIVHVDTNGTARLLKEVLQMTTLPTYTNALDGKRVVADPGHVVLVTDERLIPNLGGTALRGGQPVARRLSTAHCDFPGAPDKNYAEFQGHFEFGSSVATVIQLGPNSPTNPFRHMYHPDHDNLTADYKNFAAEAYSISRRIVLWLRSAPLDGKADPAYGTERMEGEYQETVTGLHREPIEAQGGFVLRRISDIGVLN